MPFIATAFPSHKRRRNPKSLIYTPIRRDGGIGRRQRRTPSSNVPSHRCDRCASGAFPMRGRTLDMHAPKTPPLHSYTPSTTRLSLTPSENCALLNWMSWYILLAKNYLHSPPLHLWNT